MVSALEVPVLNDFFGHYDFGEKIKQFDDMCKGPGVLGGNAVLSWGFTLTYRDTWVHHVVICALYSIGVFSTCLLTAN